MQPITQYDPDVIEQLRQLISNPVLFAEIASKLKLRSYQEQVIRAIVSSFVAKAGLSFVVMFPRQSGKNECQAQLEVYLLTICIKFPVNIVKISPTWKPQSENAMDRLESTLKGNFLVRDYWKKESDHIYRLGQSRCIFMSGSPTASIVGATANLLLEVDEAQDISISKYDKEIAPMAASTNATRVFWGTAWTSQTLLSRELHAARLAQEKDGIQRVFMLNAGQVAEEVPAYGVFVAEQIAKLGRNHPMIRTQYFSEVLDAQTGMFPPARRALMIGSHARQIIPTPGKLYAFLLDVAGVDETVMSGFDGLTNPGRDSHTLTIIEVDLSSLAILQKPIYRTVHRIRWTGQNHVVIFGQLQALAEAWNMRYLVMDATGTGEGLYSMAYTAWSNKVIPVKFSQSKKSEVGWGWISIIETGRWREYVPFDAEFDHQLDHCQMEILPGPQKTMRWGVPENTRDHAGTLIHDDDILSAALSTELDNLEWIIQTKPQTVETADPLKDMERNF